MTARAARLGLAAVLALAVVAGWRELWFLTDDAYIAFRYVDQAAMGRGLVWNPPPFAPVEGYTSFLWAALLLMVRLAAGIEPPAAANPLALTCTLGILALLWRRLETLPLAARLEPARFALVALALLAVAANRTVLTWASSGLETALFVLLFAWWVIEAARPGAERGRGWLARLALAAALAALARPDGLLAAAATPLVAWLDWRERGGSLRPRLAEMAPLAGVAVHVLWRRGFYGAWLPNTFAAKSSAGWPEAGVRYLGAFLVEYGYVLWLPLLAAALLRRAAATGWRVPPRLAVPLAVLALHLATYVLLIGGDHFEYRVLAHLCVLAPFAAWWAVTRLARTPRTAVALLALLLGATLPLPWLAWADERAIVGRRATKGRVPQLAARLPAPLAPVGHWWEGQQSWLLSRGIGVRRSEHAEFLRWMAERLPPREVGAAIPWEDRPVLAASGVGLVGWLFPNVAIIDTRGLNDRVVARHLRTDRSRYMAHDRRPPPGYVECFRPNVEARSARVRPRTRPLTDAEIIGCERRFLR